MHFLLFSRFIAHCSSEHVTVVCFSCSIVHSRSLSFAFTFLQPAANFAEYMQSFILMERMSMMRCELLFCLLCFSLSLEFDLWLSHFSLFAVPDLLANVKDYKATSTRNFC